ncbi:hypothetical protein FJZ31_24510 [Candidatus Poribacteria bacterium]|nr:hypothetical protein [Candidatus Poribacteria bacterium]
MMRTISITTLIFISLFSVFLSWGKEIDPNDIDWSKAENLALNKPVNAPKDGTDQFKANPGWGPKEKATNGNRDTNDWMGWNEVGKKREEIGWCEIDLKELLWVDTIRIWHYYGDQRTYHHVKLAVSTKSKFEGEEVVIFDGDDKSESRATSWIGDVADDKSVKFKKFGGGEYQETPGGRLDHFKPVKAQYVRDWVFGSTSNTAVHWVEIEVYSFLGPGSVTSSGKLPIAWGAIKSYN